MPESVRRRGMALSAALHAAVLLLLLAYRPHLGAFPDLEPPLTVNLLPESVPVVVVRPEVPAPNLARQAGERHRPAPLAREPAGSSKAGAPARGSATIELPAQASFPLDFTGGGIGDAAPDSGVGASGSTVGTGSGSATGTGTGTGSGAGEGSGGEGGGGSGKDRASARPLGAEWIYKPSSAEMTDHLPGRALYGKVSGVAKLACLVDARNRARRCRVVSEAPLGYGFGGAARRLSRLFRIKPPIVDGRPSHVVWVTTDVIWEHHEAPSP